ncbi:hypothetical protein SAMN05192549_10340 [Duganella sacchari]|uniref:Uncharacterized protein n=1 Tax=Duganella sacchari TaxID=551987 RepID=A0A1M7M667_9BURK|nr:hypothetical protein SAMN05192549_10340 [Duganella sacchari]
MHYTGASFYLERIIFCLLIWILHSFTKSYDNVIDNHSYYL